MKALILVIALLGLAACDKPNSDGTYNRAKAESEAGKDTQNKNQEEKARLMEQDLQRRYRFYKAVSENYSGEFKREKYSYVMKASFSPTFHVIDSGRVRTLEEIQDDLNNLFLNARVVITDKAGDLGIPPCVFEKVRPDIMNGVIQLVAPSCPNKYTIYLTTPTTPRQEVGQQSAILARALLDGVQTVVEHLFIDVSPGYIPDGYSVLMTKQ